MTVRCLIVDDNDRFLQTARATLEREGIDVVGVASTSAEAIQRTEQLRPDVALIDICLGAPNAASISPGNSQEPDPRSGRRRS